MSLEIVQGNVADPVMAHALRDVILTRVQEGTLYIGYPVIAADDRPIRIDALLIAQATGLVAFQLCAIPDSRDHWATVVDEQDELFTVFSAQLARQSVLREGRTPIITLNTVSVFPENPGVAPSGAEGDYLAIDKLDDYLASRAVVTAATVQRVESALQHVDNMKPRKRRSGVQRADSMGARLKVMERAIANMDKWQKRAAIETVEGPQRIRGLAGSGKTVVLCHKAAYLHAKNPDWVIALTFQSRSLYQQLEGLVQRFSFDQIGDSYDPEKLLIKHAWGGSRLGIYSMISHHVGLPPYDWNTARGRFGYEMAFQGACRELLQSLHGVDVVPLFDAVLIDEAQDLPAEFFQLVYLFTKEPKRVVWAYDEMQRLNETTMAPLEEMFGTLNDGTPVVSLDASPNGPSPDIVLPVCYRNTPWAIATAHAFGFGVYRTGGMIQHFDDPDMWKRVGYRVASGELSAARSVNLVRDESSVPPYYADMDSADAVQCATFPSTTEQDTWLAKAILNNITHDELDPDDILVVLPDVRTAKKRALSIRAALAEQDLLGHLVGVDIVGDQVFRPNSVAMAHIYRAKGNEAPMVYVVDAESSLSPFNAITNRNILFTSVTRSRGWVRLLGTGVNAETLREEFDRLASAEFHLEFVVPTEIELDHMRRVNRERSRAELEQLTERRRKYEAGLRDLLEDDEIDLAALDPDLLRWLRDRMPE